MKQLYRSRENRVLTGVCGGLGEYFEIDPIIVRLVWTIMAFAGVGIIAYIFAAIIIPDSPNPSGYNNSYNNYESSTYNTTHNNVQKNGFIFGTILIILGGYFFLEKNFSWFRISRLWPLILIIIGGFLIFNNKE